MKSIKIFIILFVSLFFVVFTSKAFASTIFFNNAPPSSSGYVQNASCNTSVGCTDLYAPSVCWNSQSAGTTDCGTACSGGAPWTKYNNDGCYQDPYGGCVWYFEYNSVVYSTADKCWADGPYLRAGLCSGATGGIYKYCCNPGGGVASSYCVQVPPYSGAPYPPYDGQCPSGTNTVFGSDPSVCGSPAPGAPSTTNVSTSCSGLNSQVTVSYSSGSGSSGTQIHYSVDSTSLGSVQSLSSSPTTITGQPSGPGHRFYFNLYSCDSSGSCSVPDPNGYYYIDLETCGGGGATATPTPTPTTSGSFCSGTCGTSSFSGSCTTSGGQPGTWQWDGSPAQSKSNCDNVYAYCYNCIATSGPTAPPPASCSTAGLACGTGCCSGLVCSGGVCQFPPPPPTVASCGKSGEACGIGCCSGLVCTASNTCLAPTPTPVPHVTVQGHFVDATGSDLSLNIGQSVTIKQSGSSPLAPQFQSLGYFWSNSLPPSTYTVTATVPNNYTVASSTCVNCTTHSSYASTNPVTVSLPSNGNYADIYFRYTLKTCTTTFSGNVVVDPDTNDCTSLAALGGTAYNGFGQVTAYNGTSPAAQQVNLSSGAYSSLSYSPICGSDSFITLSGVLYPVTGVCDNGVYHAQASYTYPYTNTNSPTENRNVTYLLTSQGPWFQVDTGDVRFPNINNKIPKGANASASGASLFASSVGNTLLGKGNFPLTSNWQVNQEYAYNSDFENGLGSMSYTFYMSRAAQLQMLPTKNNVTSPIDLSTLGSGIYQTDGDLSITASSGIDGTCATGGKHVLLLVGGNATVNGPISVPAGHCNLFVLAAKSGITFAPAVGTSTFSSAVSNVDGYYTSEGNIVLNGTNNCASGTDKRLNVGGALIANSLHPFARLGLGKIIVNRNICAANATYPTYYVSPRPDFYLQMSDFYKIPYKTIKEVEP